VILAATIDKQGKVEQVKPVSGHPLLIQAALDAVKQWTYKPFQLNGQTLQVQTTIKVVFRM
jgi:protein TonB